MCIEVAYRHFFVNFVFFYRKGRSQQENGSKYKYLSFIPIYYSIFGFHWSLMRKYQIEKC